MVIKVSFVVELIVKKMFSFVFMGQPLDPISMSVLKCAFSLRSNLFASFVKEILSWSIKNTVTELWVNRVCQLILLVTEQVNDKASE